MNNVNSTIETNKKLVSDPPKKTIAGLVDRYLDEIKGFENDRINLAKTSANKAWWVAGGFALIAVIAIVAIMLLTPLKSVELRVIKVNESDGSVSIISEIVDGEGITYGEVLDEYWAKDFIKSRNSYNWETAQHNYNSVKIMSNDIVYSTYNSYIRADNSPLKIFEDKKRIIIEIQDVTFLPTKSEDSKLAQVRFSRDIVNKIGISDSTFKKTFWNATITFDYNKIIRTDDERTLNPLGFRVTSYTEDRVSIK